MDRWWLAERWQVSPVWAASWVLWVIGSIVLHELGHGWAAMRRGDTTPRDTGHMTWNPMVHMGGVSLICFLLFGFTWGMMPVDPSRMRGRFADAYVAAAGPAMNFGLGVLCVLADGVWLRVGPGVAASNVVMNVHTFLWTGAMINVVGVLFNLLPVPPLDGSRIVANFVPAYGRFIYSEKGALFGLLSAALLFQFAGRFIWPATEYVATYGCVLAAQLLGGNWISPL